MCRIHHSRLVFSWIGSLLIALMLTAAAVADPPPQRVDGQGEVAGDNVYVRSGASLNHYVICKLNAGDRVTIVGERNGWYEIVPPDGVFSLISGDYVDTPDDKIGVVNGNNVRVRAGSLLNDRKYTIQTKLSKGVEVSILDRDPDGFLRIVPPDGVTVWISGDFVERVPAPRLDHERVAEAPTETSRGSLESADATTSDIRGEKEAPSGEVGRPASLLGALPPTDARRDLAQIDADAAAEFTKPLVERRLQPFVERYQRVAERDEDEFARRYAQARIEQLDHMAAVAETVRKVRKLDEQTKARRRDLMRTRTATPAVSVPMPSELDAQGELRVSALYPPGSLPHRYRLVDPTTPPGRTIAYVDVPADSTLNPSAFIGRYVGVRATQRHLQAGGVNPIPIYVARELVLLEPTVAAVDTAASD